MEHPIQFTINFDDETLKRRIAQSAEQQVIKNITDEVAAELFGVDYYGRPKSGYVAVWVHEKVGDFLTAHKDEIIAKASKELAVRLYRSKNVREAAGEVAKEAYGGGC